MLQGTAEKIQRLHPLDTLPVTSAHEQSFASYLPAFTRGGKSNHSFPDLVPPSVDFHLHRVT